MSYMRLKIRYKLLEQEDVYLKAILRGLRGGSSLIYIQYDSIKK
jgi:hypothetical protein